MQKLIDAIVEVESGGDVNAIGDFGKAHGPMQIHQACLDDVNNAYQLSLTLDDVKGEKGLENSMDVFKKYMAIYATRKRIGRDVTDQDRARIWNGGPNGWQRSATRHYWIKVSEILYARK